MVNSVANAVEKSQLQGDLTIVIAVRTWDLAGVTGCDLEDVFLSPAPAFSLCLLDDVG